MRWRRKRRSISNNIICSRHAKNVAARFNWKKHEILVKRKRNFYKSILDSIGSFTLLVINVSPPGIAYIEGTIMKPMKDDDVYFRWVLQWKWYCNIYFNKRNKQLHTNLSHDRDLFHHTHTSIQLSHKQPFQNWQSITQARKLWWETIQDSKIKVIF